MKRILVVDDDPGVRELLADLLHEQYIVSVARNGAEALESLHQYLPDAVILDMMMPIMDGWAFLKARRRTRLAANIPVMVVSAEPTACQDGMRLGAQACMPKPFDVSHFAGAVDQLFATSARTDL